MLRSSGFISSAYASRVHARVSVGASASERLLRNDRIADARRESVSLAGRLLGLYVTVEAVSVSSLPARDLRPALPSAWLSSSASAAGGLGNIAVCWWSALANMATLAQAAESSEP